MRSCLRRFLRVSHSRALRADLFGELESFTSKIFKLVNRTVAELVRVPLLACDVLSACSNNVALLP